MNTGPTQEASMLEVMAGVWDTYEMYGQLREHSPVFHVPEVDAWVLTRYDDVMTVVRDTKRFGAFPLDLVGDVPEQVKDELPHGYAPWQPALINLDPPEHTRIRKLAGKPLTPRVVAKREDEVRDAANGLIDRFVADGRADLVGDFAMPLPIQVLIKILGVPPEDHLQFRDWALGVIELFVPTITDDRRLELAREQVHFNNYIQAAIDARRADPRDDLISGLILVQEEDEKQLTDREILGVVGQLIIGGISFALYTLAKQPEVLERLKDDFGLIPTAVEESLRRLTPARGLVRRVKEDCEFHGQRIPAGDNIFAMLQSANNDDTVFTCPHKFDLDRDPAELRQSLHFGIGPHKCLGAPLARLDLRVAIEQIITRLPGLRLVEGQEIRVQPGMILHRPERLMFEWEV
jgi:cytochrome P450